MRAVPLRQPRMQFQQRGIRVEMQPELMYSLLRCGAIHAADLHCLDCDSKHCLLRLCLKACAENLAMELNTAPLRLPLTHPEPSR